MTLQKLADFNSSLETTRASIAESKKRIADLEKQSQSVPARLTTEMKESDNSLGTRELEVDVTHPRE